MNVSTDMQIVADVIRTTSLDDETRSDMVERIAERVAAVQHDFEPGIFATVCGLDERAARVVLARCGN